MPTNQAQENEPKPELTLDERFDKLEAAVGKIAGAIAAQQKTIAELAERATVESSRAPAAEELPPGPQPLPAGTVRFWSRFKEYAIRMWPEKKMVVNGEVIRETERWIHFSQGLYQTNDHVAIEFLRNCKDFGSVVIEDPHARPHPGPTVVDGPRTSPTIGAGRARDGLAARL
jgi:hypothetical protein